MVTGTLFFDSVAERSRSRIILVEPELEPLLDAALTAMAAKTVTNYNSLIHFPVVLSSTQVTQTQKKKEPIAIC
jgi:hypothetical protein